MTIYDKTNRTVVLKKYLSTRRLNPQLNELIYLFSFSAYKLKPEAMYIFFKIYPGKKVQFNND